MAECSLRIRIVLAALLPVVLVWTAPGSAQSYTERTLELLRNPPAGIVFPVKTEQRVLTLLNRLRAAKGLSTLRSRDTLRDAARVHSVRMLRDDFFAHEDPDGRGAPDRVAAVDRRHLYKYFGENLALIRPPREDSAKTVHDGWVDSPGHYKNMISPRPTHIGVGCAILGRTLTCTQVFAGAAGSLKRDLPPRLTKDDGHRVGADVFDLNFGGWSLVDRQGHERAAGSGTLLRWPNRLSGEYQLRVNGKRRQGNRIYTHPFFGPSVVLGSNVHGSNYAPVPRRRPVTASNGRRR